MPSPSDNPKQPGNMDDTLCQLRPITCDNPRRGTSENHMMSADQKLDAYPQEAMGGKFVNT